VTFNALLNGDLGIRVSYTLEDAVYLTEPVVLSGEYRKVSDGELTVFECDPEAAVRHFDAPTD